MLYEETDEVIEQQYSSHQQTPTKSIAAADVVIEPEIIENCDDTDEDYVFGMTPPLPENDGFDDIIEISKHSSPSPPTYQSPRPEQMNSFQVAEKRRLRNKSSCCFKLYQAAHYFFILPYRHQWLHMVMRLVVCALFIFPMLCLWIEKIKPYRLLSTLICYPPGLLLFVYLCVTGFCAALNYNLAELPFLPYTVMVETLKSTYNRLLVTCCCAKEEEEDEEDKGDDDNDEDKYFDNLEKGYEDEDGSSPHLSQGWFSHLAAALMLSTAAVPSRNRKETKNGFNCFHLLMMNGTLFIGICIFVSINLPTLLFPATAK